MGRAVSPPLALDLTWSVRVLKVREVGTIPPRKFEANISPVSSVKSEMMLDLKYVPFFLFSTDTACSQVGQDLGPGGKEGTFSQFPHSEVQACEDQ